MSLPIFYISEFDEKDKQLVLPEDSSRHVIQVLRMKKGEQLQLTDGKGNLLTCTIFDDHKKHCVVQVNEINFRPQSTKKVVIAISVLKNANRFEWFLEKATEIGVSEIIPLLCDRTEKEKFRFDRMKGICVSAMLQSQQVWLPSLSEPVPFNQFMDSRYDGYTKYVAHCEENKDKQLLTQNGLHHFVNKLILIGPEGDFTAEEIGQAIQNDFVPVSLGETRLRTETAGVVAAALLINKY